MKKKLLLIIVFLLIFTVGCKKQTQVSDDQVITFKDESLNISANDLYDSLKEKYGTSILIDMMDTKILDKEYPDSDEIEAYVNNQIASIKNYYKTDSEFLEYINNYGYKDEEELKTYFRLNRKRSLAVEDFIKKTLSDEEIQKYYDDNISGDITGSHILIEVKSSSTATEEEKRTAKEEALNKAKEAIEKLNNGTSFEDVAKEYSTDDATKNNGGKMGTFNSLDLDDVTRQEYAKIKVSEYSKTPIETEYGYEIFMKNEEKEKPSLDSVKSKITKKISEQKLIEDNKLQYKGLINLRKKYGFDIKDEDLKVYYENSMNNALKSE